MDHNFSFTQRNLSHIGYQLLKQRPEVAEEIINVSPLPDDMEDFNKIPQYLDRYLSSIGVTIDHITINNNLAITEKKRLFMAALLRIYYPAVFSSPTCYFKPQRGFIKMTRQAMRMDKSNTSKMAYRVRTMIWVYDDFTAEALSIHSKITQQDAAE